MTVAKKLNATLGLGMRDVEETIIRQIADIDKEISDLQDERRVLERLLLKARREDVARMEVARKNSITRILVENKIIEALNDSSKPMSGRDLYSYVRTVVYDLNDSTFRSHLKRMKDRGVIQQLPGHGGRWFLPNE